MTMMIIKARGEIVAFRDVSIISATVLQRIRTFMECDGVHTVEFKNV